jgi:hypothetical protein
VLNDAKAILAALKADPENYVVALPIYKALPKTFYKTLAFLMTEEEVEASYGKDRELVDDEDLAYDLAYSTFITMFYHEVGQDYIDKDIYRYFPEELEADAAQWLSKQGVNLTEGSVIGHYEAWITKRVLHDELATELTSRSVLVRKRKI